MSEVDAETSVRALGDGRYTTRLDAAWNIGANPNGGYALLPALRAMLDVAAHPDPLSVTVHFLRPATGDRDADVTADIVRTGRSTTNATATMAQDGTLRLVAHAVLGDLTEAAPDAAPDPGLALAPPDLPPPDRCIDRRELGQGVDLPILSRAGRAHPTGAGRSGARPEPRSSRGGSGSPTARHRRRGGSHSSPTPSRRHYARGWVRSDGCRRSS